MRTATRVQKTLAILNPIVKNGQNRSQETPASRRLDRPPFTEREQPGTPPQGRSCSAPTLVEAVYPVHHDDFPASSLAALVQGEVVEVHLENHYLVGDLGGLVVRVGCVPAPTDESLV